MDRVQLNGRSTSSDASVWSESELQTITAQSMSLVKVIEEDAEAGEYEDSMQQHY